MKLEAAQKMARQLFGAKAYANKLEFCGRVEITRPCRIGIDVDDKTALPLGAGLEWEDAFSRAKKSPEGQRLMKLQAKSRH